jgi:hypothetical protein
MQEWHTDAHARNTDVHALHYGNAREPLARVIQDERRPSMWRIRWPDGQRSDMTNLSRAKDAAAAIAERGPPARNRRRLHWQKERSKSTVEAPPIAPEAEFEEWDVPEPEGAAPACPRTPRRAR